ncbi:MAG: hypothetical protein JNK61_06225 [Bacteroidia bacterium]|nr:hypothetical protein [Bacteroidia bacterium]
MELCQQQEMECMTVFEDQWYKQQPIILSRIIHTTKQSKRVFARTLELSNLDKTTAENFYNQNHLLGSVAGWKNIALQKQTVYAVATFSKSRLMNYDLPHFRSYELLRFATLNQYSVTGGLSKILTHFIEITGAKHIMTYTDSALGSGKSFEILGFKYIETVPPQAFIISSNYIRIPSNRNNDTGNSLLKVYNAGSKKYVLDLR